MSLRTFASNDPVAASVCWPGLWAYIVAKGMLEGLK